MTTKGDDDDEDEGGDDDDEDDLCRVKEQQMKKSFPFPSPVFSLFTSFSMSVFLSFLLFLFR